MKSICLAALAAGLFVFAGNLPANAQFIITGLSATSNSPGTPALALLTLSIGSIENTTDQTHTLTIAVSDSGFTLPAPGPLTLTSATSGLFLPVPGTGATLVDDSSVTLKTFADATNVVNGTGFPAENFTTTAPPNSATFAFAHTGSVPGFNPSGPYSLSIQETFTLSGHAILTGVSTTLRAEPAAVPEPGGLAFVGAGALSMLCYAWRRLKQPA